MSKDQNIALQNDNITQVHKASGSGRKNILLLVAMIENEFSYSVIEGAMLGAKEQDYNLFILPGGIIDADYDDKRANMYRYQYNTLYYYVKCNHIDAIVVDYGTIASTMREGSKKKLLKLFEGLPVILLTGIEDGFSNVLVDNKEGLKDLFEHLIEHHKARKIGFVSGPVVNDDARERLDVYHETMEGYGLPHNEDYVAYGNFSEFCEPQVNELLDRHPDLDAICCANDRMAMGVYNVLEQRGMQPGKDIIVTGFDDSPDAMILEPHLTTVRNDTVFLSYKAILGCKKLMAGEEVHEKVGSRLIVRESCGCKDVGFSNANVSIAAEKNYQATEERFSAVLEEFIGKPSPTEEEKRKFYDNITNINKKLLMSITVEKTNPMERRKVFEILLASITRDMLQYADDEISKYEVLVSKFYNIGIRSSYIYDFGEIIDNPDINTWETPEDVYVRSMSVDRKYNVYPPKTKKVAVKDAFVNEYLPNRRITHLVLPLFSGTQQFGLISVEADIEYYLYCMQIAMQMSVSLDVIEIIKKQNAIKAELETSLKKSEEVNKMLDQASKIDPLTNIYNRRGFIDNVTGMLQDQMNLGCRAVAFYLDMDNLKIVNDEFGHDDGDFALRTISSALRKSFRNSDVTARMGGDEFAAFALVKDSDFADVIKTRINEALDEMNENDKPYYVHVSIGSYEFEIDGHNNIDKIMDQADKALYAVKKSKVKVIYKGWYKKQKEEAAADKD
jgi:diguanylate cyclase (GGDEF)-like protein